MKVEGSFGIVFGEFWVSFFFRIVGSSFLGGVGIFLVFWEVEWDLVGKFS